jgi:hypothetical protein
MRAACPQANVNMRHERTGGVYSGIRAALSVDQTINGMGATQQATGAVRLDCSELQEPHPKAGDKVAVAESEQAGFVDRVVTAARYDQMRATVRIEYGEQYG